MRLFISYAHENQSIVNEWIVNKLTAAGHDAWFDDRLIAGQDWKQQLGQEIRRSDALVYCITPASVESDWCLWEVATAAALDIPIIPVILQANTQLPEQLGTLQFVDFSYGPTGDAVDRLLRGLQHVAPSQVPPAPQNPRGIPPQAKKMDQSNRVVLYAAMIGAVGAIVAAVITILPNFMNQNTASTLPPTPTSVVINEPTTAIPDEPALTSVPPWTQQPATTNTPTDVAAPAATATSPPTSTSAPVQTSRSYPCSATVDPFSGSTVLNVVRQFPTRTAQIVDSVRRGDEVLVLERSAGADVFYRIQSDGRTVGWIAEEYLQLSNNCP